MLVGSVPCPKNTLPRPSSHAIVSSAVGPEYYVSIMSFVDKTQLEPGCSVLLHNKVRARACCDALSRVGGGAVRLARRSLSAGAGQRAAAQQGACGSPLSSSGNAHSTSSMPAALQLCASPFLSLEWPSWR